MFRVARAAARRAAPSVAAFTSASFMITSGVALTEKSPDFSYVLKSDKTWGVLNSETELMEAPDSVPLMTLEEVQSHDSESSCYVTLNGDIYDVTEFLKHHPGGQEALLGAAGQDLEQFWSKYQLHYRKDIMSVLAPYKVGVLSEEDAERARKISTCRVDPQTGKNSKFLSNAVNRGYRRLASVVAVAATYPLWELTRFAVRAIGFFGHLFGGRSLANYLTKALPISVPGYVGAAKLPVLNSKGERTKIAVVGGGIAGVGAAHSLQESGYDVVLYEARDVLGGNAQVATYDCDGVKVSQDLSVLFWDKEYYANYTALLKKVNVTPCDVTVAYLLHTNASGKWEYYTPPNYTEAYEHMQPSLYPRLKNDFDKYDRMISIAKTCNWFFTFDESKSFYKHVGLWSIFNPMNFVTMKQLSKLTGISDEFYETVIRPFNGYQFSTIFVDDLPAVALPVLDDIVPITSTRKHTSWGVGNSSLVFERATENVNVKLKTRVRRVEKFYPESASFLQRVLGSASKKLRVYDDQGNVEEFDRIVFSCSAGYVANIMQNDLSWVEKALLLGVKYHDDFERGDWSKWIEVPVHQDDDLVIPKTGNVDRDFVKKTFAFIVDVDCDHKDDGHLGARYDHLLGAWSPSASKLNRHGASMHMSQAMRSNDEVDPSKLVKTFSPPRAHPDLCVQNMMITQLLSLVQGRDGVFYTGNYVSAGNGHDLSFTTGLCVAEVIGAKYPFEDAPKAKRDVKLMRRFMGV